MSTDKRGRRTQRPISHLCSSVFIIAWLPCYCLAAEPVAFAEGKLTMRYSEGVPNWVSGKPGNNINFNGRLTDKGPRTFKTLILSNRYLRVEIVPEAGGAVARVVYLPSDTDMFHLAESCNNGVVGWTSGVKISFPYKEHGIRLPDQPASWRLVRDPCDGSAAVALWMEFSRGDGPWTETMFGRYGNMLLSQHVALRPEEAAFRVTYRVVNPTPYRQGRQLWNVATWPRRQGELGPSKTEWVFPASHVSSHSGERFRPYDFGERPLAELGGASVFGWAMRHPFVGLWYPRARVNRLRITDPNAALGGKQFYDAESDRPRGVELWTGSDSIFEQVEHWIDPGESFQCTLTYAMTEKIGKVDFANERVAVNVELGGDAPRVEAVTYRPVKALGVLLDRKRVGEAIPCSPEEPARFAMPAGAKEGRISLVADGETILDQRFPLKVEADDKQYEVIRKTTTGDETWEKLGDSESLGRSYHRAPYPAGTTARGRIGYRSGSLDAAVAALRQATAADAGDGEAWHLLGAALLERGQDANAQAAFGEAVKAKRPYAAARYFLALAEIAAGRNDRAATELDDLRRERPGHWEGRLLLAWLCGPAAPVGKAGGAGGHGIARRLAAEDPADPRALHVLWKACERTGAEAEGRAAKAALDSVLAEPGAQRRLEEFLSATRGRYAHPNRMKTWDQWRKSKQG